MPAKMGLVNGRIGRIPQATDMHDEHCQTRAAPAGGNRFRASGSSDLISAAARSNVAFYPMAVPMLVPALPDPAWYARGRRARRCSTIRVDGGLGMLASGTDGL